MNSLACRDSTTWSSTTPGERRVSSGLTPGYEMKECVGGVDEDVLQSSRHGVLVKGTATLA